MKLLFRLPHLLAPVYFLPGIFIVLVRACTRVEPTLLPAPPQPEIVASPMPTLAPLPVVTQPTPENQAEAVGKI